MELVKVREEWNVSRGFSGGTRKPVHTPWLSGKKNRNVMLKKVQQQMLMQQKHINSFIFTTTHRNKLELCKH